MKRGERNSTLTAEVEKCHSKNGATQLILAGFGSTMHGGIKSLLFSMPYLQKQMSQEEERSVKQFDYYYIQKKALQRRYIVQHQNLKEFRPD